MIDKIKEYKEFIQDFDLLTFNNFRMKNKLKLYLKVDTNKMRKWSYILEGDSIKDINDQIDILFNDSLELNSEWNDIRLNIIDTNKTQLKLF